MQVFETASEGGEPAAFGILVDHSGAIRVVPAEGWRPEALQAHYGARTVFQVTRTPHEVRVVGQSLGGRCMLERTTPRLDCYPAIAPLALLP
jgi:hypothetical protein